jgi:hypothetical protein|tara:strand:+ start:123 stop:1115 length:993 start_codon:yes stop_codon:yes gene_type:complete
MAIYLGSLELATGAAAATGTGFPVNSYAPFFVTGTGTPTTGYNATTGLYNHPNGDVWIETGKTIIDASNAYPDATGQDVITNDFVTVNTTSSNSGPNTYQFFQGDSFYIVGVRWSSQQIYFKYDNSDNYLGTFNLGSYALQAIDVGENNLIVRQMQSPYAMYRYTNNGVYISQESYNPSYYNDPMNKNLSTTWIAANTFVGATSGTPGGPTTVGKWDTSTNTTTAPFPINGGGCFWDSTNDRYYLTSPYTPDFYLYNGPISGVTGTGVALQNNGNAYGYHNGYFYSMSNGGNNAPVVITKNSGLGKQVGNSTIQYGGSSASNIPMFVKLK